MTTNGVLLSLPASTDAPGIREGIGERAQWKLEELVEGWGAVEPIEGAGVVFPYFKAHKLCDAKTQLTAETWEPLRRNPGWAKNDLQALRTSPSGAPDPDWQKYLLEWGDKVAKEGRRGSDLAAVSATLTALPPEQVPDYLQAQVPAFFEGNPNGSFWFFEVDPLAPRRIALLRVLLALEMVPDLLEASGPPLPKIRTLQEHSLTNGIAFEALVEPLLLAIPPTALGYSFSLMPHGLVFLFGHPTLITEKHPPTVASLYVPRLHGSGAGFHWRESDFWEGVGGAEVETLFQWWVSRLNVIYSHALDVAGLLA